MQFALGELGWTPYEYYTSLPGEFYAACLGHQEKELKAAKLLRFAAFRISEAMAGSKAIGPIERFWPMDGDKKQKKAIEMTPERVKAIFERHKIKTK